MFCSFTVILPTVSPLPIILVPVGLIESPKRDRQTTTSKCSSRNRIIFAGIPETAYEELANKFKKCIP